MEKVALIIVTYVKTDFQRDLLKKSVDSVLQYHPDATLVVLNDNHEELIESYLPKSSKIRYELTKHPKCGEVNAFVWSCAHTEEFTKFIFIHDSVILHGRIPTTMETRIHFRPLWYAPPFFASVGLMLQEVEDVIKDIQIGPSLGPAIYQIILNRYIFVTFGCMGVWDRDFCKFLSTKTNIITCAGRFNTRNLRCLFERVIYICFAYMHHDVPFRHFASLSICGDINNHESAFSNIKLDSSVAKNPYALKVWQGR
jgi:hypothetical protein